MIVSAILWQAATEPPVRRTIVDILTQAAAIIGALTVVGGGFLWLVLPRLKEWLRREIASPVQATHKSVTVNGGKNSPPTLLDKVHFLAKQVERIEGQTEQLITVSGATAQRTSDLADELDLVKDIARDARDDLRHHITSGEQYLGRVQLVMKAQGIELPHSDE